MGNRMSHPSAHNQRSLAEPMLLSALTSIIRSTINRNERQLAQMCRDLIEMTGDRPNVKRYIDMKAVQVMDGESGWG